MTNDIIPRSGSPLHGQPDIPLGAYRCVYATDTATAGSYVRAYQVNAGAVAYRYGRQYATLAINDFLYHFVHEPDSDYAFTDALQSTLSDIDAIKADVANLQQALSQVSVHTGVGQDTEGLEAVNAIVHVQDRSPVGVKRTLAQVRHLVKEKQDLLKVKQESLQALIDEKMSLARAIMEPMQEMVRQLEEGIWTINLYLGRNEELVQLLDGEPAPAETPITLRQLVLAMDEECAVAADEGGIDARDIPQFDAWLREDPDHVDQVLPEPKGVVVLVPRWHNDKRYEDPWTTAALKEANRESYFLIRNGERLYRVSMDFQVGSHLVPTRDAFLHFFEETTYNPKTGQHEKRTLTPGSADYMKAEKAADARTRHYLRVGLILQGLIDRTPVFHPLPGPIQITGVDAYAAGHVQIVTDGELTLSDGRERFDAWQERINAELRPGMRIIGSFSGWSQDSRTFGGMSDKGRHERLSPETADYPTSNELYLLEGKRGDGFYFLYDRESRYRDYERRATCVVKTRDRFILNYDAATVEEMEWYLRSRLDRRSYTSMFPVLKAAIRMKRQEAAEEAPFLQLLASEIVKRYAVEWEVAEAEVSDLVAWWKFKNRNHRPLVGDDEGKALSMIVSEFQTRLWERENRQRRQESGEFDQVVSHVRQSDPDTLLIAHKSGNEYTVLVPANDQSVYVHERIVTVSRGRPSLRESRDWRTVDNRMSRWHTLYRSPRLDTWNVHASRSEHLTDPEIYDLGGMVLPETFLRWTSSRYADRYADYRMLAVTFDRDRNAFHIYYLETEGAIPLNLLTGKIKEPEIGCLEWSWGRNVQRTAELREPESQGVSWPTDGKLPWDADLYRYGGLGYRTKRAAAEIVIMSDTMGIQSATAAFNEHRAAEKERRRLKSVAWAAYRSIVTQWEDRAKEAEYAAFMQEYGDPELWEGYKKVQFPYHPNNTYGFDRDITKLDRMTYPLVEEDFDFNGLTVAEVAKLVGVDLATLTADIMDLRYAYDPEGVTDD